MKKSEFPISELTPAEKLQLVEDLWDELAAEPESVPVQDWVCSELRRRKAKHLDAPGKTRTFTEARRRIRARHGR